jgi:hypothetical protein
MFRPDPLILGAAFHEMFGYERPMYTLAHNTVRMVENDMSDRSTAKPVSEGSQHDQSKPVHPRLLPIHRHYAAFEPTRRAKSRMSSAVA